MLRSDDIARQGFQERAATIALSALLFVSVFSCFVVWRSDNLLPPLLFLISALLQSASLISLRRKNLASFLPTLAIIGTWLALIFSLSQQSLVLQLSPILSFTSYFLVSLVKANWINGIVWATLIFSLHSAGQPIPIAAVISAVVFIIFANLIVNRLKRLALELADSHITDRVTGCSNRDALFKEMEKAWELYKRYGVQTSALTLKIVNFDDCVDLHGREKSDLLLAEVVQVWTSRLRNTDLLCRYGDDQFVCLLPNTKLDNAGSLASDLCQASSDYEFSVGGEMQLDSIVSEIADDDHWESWLKKALTS